MNDFAGLRLKTCSFLKGNNDEDKKAKGKKSGSYKKTLNQVNHLGNTQINLKTQQRFKSKKHYVFTEEINKVLQVQMMIKEYNQLILLKHMHMKRVKFQYVRKKKLNVTIQ